MFGSHLSKLTQEPWQERNRPDQAGDAIDVGGGVLAVMPLSILTGIKQPAIAASASHPSVDRSFLPRSSQVKHL